MAACVTINVYFPEAEAKEAVSKSTDYILGTKKKQEGNNQSSIDIKKTIIIASREIMNFIIPSANAASSPAVQKIETQLKNKFAELSRFFDTGVVGYTNNGFVAIKDLNAAAVKDKITAKKLVASVNSNLKQLYKERAKADGNAAWAKKYQDIYSKDWIKKAKKGWWYQKSNGSWTKK